MLTGAGVHMYSGVGVQVVRRVKGVFMMVIKVLILSFIILVFVGCGGVAPDIEHTSKTDFTFESVPNLEHAYEKPSKIEQKINNNHELDKSKEVAVLTSYFVDNSQELVWNNDSGGEITQKEYNKAIKEYVDKKYPAKAKAYNALMKEFGFTQEQVASSVGKSRAAVANTLRLLTLPKIVKDALFKDQISRGHAKAILSLTEAVKQIELLSLILKKGLSVREAEMFCVLEKPVKTKKAVNKDEHVVNLEEELRQIFGTKVSLFHGKKRGKIQIEYYSLDDLDRVLRLIRGQ